jgi:MtrB/PioB family decaheme-associated outer membrane protein
VKAAYHFNERDNKTPIESWSRVLVDTFNSTEVETNKPYSFEKTRFKLSGDFDVWPTLRLSAGYERTDHDRDFQEVAEQTEEIGWGKLRWRPNALISIDIKGGTAERDVNRYNEAIATTLRQNPLLRKYNLAYRFREFGELKVAASLPKTPVSLTGSVLYANDDYSQSLLGITEDEDIRVAVDLSWTVSENASVYAFGSYEDIEAKQTGSEQFAAVDWRTTNKDSFYTFGVGIRLKQIVGNIDLDLDYTRSDGNTEIDISSASGGNSQFPDLESQLDSLRGRLTWRRTERQEFTFRFRYEHFDSDDWALQNVGPATIPVVLSLGAQPYDYDVLLIGISFRYLIGDHTSTLTDEE